LTKALVQGASMKGVKCILGEKVLSLTSTKKENPRYCNVVNLQSRSLSADWIILATGLGTSPLISPLGSNITVKPVLGQALLIKHPSWQTQENFSPIITGNDIHIVPRTDNEIWLGATVEFPDMLDRVIPDEELLKNLQKSAIEFCPSLAQAPIMLSWTGKRPRPEGKSAPIIEKLDNYDNIILATGHYRNGILLAPATASSVSQLMKK